jgi:DNA-binding CsgD family transcriptional regulator
VSSAAAEAGLPLDGYDLRVILAIAITGCYMFILPDRQITQYFTRLDQSFALDSKERFFELAQNKLNLSDREMEIAYLKMRGNTNRKIAELLFLSAGTVNAYQSRIYRKIGVHSRQEFIDAVSSMMD